MSTTLMFFIAIWLGCSIAMAVGRATKRFLFPWEEWRLYKYDLAWLVKAGLAVFFALPIFVWVGICWLYLNFLKRWRPEQYQKLADDPRFRKTYPTFTGGN